MIYLYSDVLGRSGGIETYLHALASHLKQERIPIVVAVSEQEPCPLLDELELLEIKVYRQRIVRGDRWHLRKHLLIRWLKYRLVPGDWVFCVRQPMPELYLKTVRSVHACGARIAVSWALAPEFSRPPAHLAGGYNQAVKETDAVISVSHCTVHQYREVYGYQGPVHVVPYHNLVVLNTPLPLPAAPPFRVGFMGRIEIAQKNLDTILASFRIVTGRRSDIELHFYGRGPDEEKLKAMAQEIGLESCISFHGPYDHRRDLKNIISACHIFVHVSRFEGGPCFSLLELLQAGRFVVASSVGGIPDIYANHPDIGCLVSPDDTLAVAAAIEDALERIAQNRVALSMVRRRYEEEFTNAFAQMSWLKALGLDQRISTVS